VEVPNSPFLLLCNFHSIYPNSRIGARDDGEMMIVERIVVKEENRFFVKRRRMLMKKVNLGLGSNRVEMQQSNP